jgi:hypothetical protein
MRSEFGGVLSMPNFLNMKNNVLLVLSSSFIDLSLPQSNKSNLIFSNAFQNYSYFVSLSTSIANPSAKCWFYLENILRIWLRLITSKTTTLIIAIIMPHLESLHQHLTHCSTSMLASFSLFLMQQSFHFSEPYNNQSLLTTTRLF